MTSFLPPLALIFETEEIDHMSSSEKLNLLPANRSATDSNPSKLMELLRKKVDEELATPSEMGMSITPNLNECLRTLGIKVYPARV